MAQVELIMPKMGESIIEATILNWVKQVGDEVEVDDTILEIATDKVDSEVPSPVDGKIAKILFEVDAVVAVGDVIAIIETEAGATVAASPATGQAVSDTAGPASPPSAQPSNDAPAPAPKKAVMEKQGALPQVQNKGQEAGRTGPGRFYSPLVRTMAAKESIGQAELDSIPGTGAKGRVNKADMIAYLKRRDNSFVNGTGAQQFGNTPAPTPGSAGAAKPHSAPRHQRKRRRRGDRHGQDAQTYCRPYGHE